MRVLVTGADGFVGHHLVRDLEGRGIATRSAVRRLRSTAAYPDTVAIGDLGRPIDWSEALDGVDQVVHLAARVHDQAASGQQMHATNVVATVRLAEQARQSGVRRFVFLSSIKVMGERSDGRPFIETDLPRPEGGYAVSKWAAERELMALASTAFGLTVLRPPLVYGPGVGANFLRLLRACDSPWPLPLKNAVAPRSLLYVGNLVHAIANVIARPQPAARTYFVTDGDDLCIGDLARRLRSLVGRPHRLFPLPAFLRQRLQQVFRPLQASPAALCTELNWAPAFSVDEGLEATVRWLREGAG
jgi:nucleoside-diphosphate-sugar epimerase